MSDRVIEQKQVKFDEQVKVNMNKLKLELLGQLDVSEQVQSMVEESLENLPTMDRIQIEIQKNLMPLSLMQKMHDESIKALQSVEPVELPKAQIDSSQLEEMVNDMRQELQDGSSKQRIDDFENQLISVQEQIEYLLKRAKNSPLITKMSTRK